MLRQVCSTAAICTFAAGSALAVAPQRTFVASHGVDINPCSLSAPCRGFQTAIDAVASGGEVVALDSAGYGAMEIHKSVSVIVPPGVHAGLSPSTGIPLPGFAGQYGVVLIDIQDNDVVVLRGLNINHQGTVTGGVEWISTHGGVVYIEGAVVNGFPKEGIYMQAPAGTLHIRDSTIRNNGVGIYGGIAGGGVLSSGGIYTDRVRIENSNVGVRALSGVAITLSNCSVDSNAVAFDIRTSTDVAKITVDRCTVLNNQSHLYMDGTSGWAAQLWVNGSTLTTPSAIGTKTGLTQVWSLGNNATEFFSFDAQIPPQ